MLAQKRYARHHVCAPLKGYRYMVRAAQRMPTPEQARSPYTRPCLPKAQMILNVYRTLDDGWEESKGLQTPIMGLECVEKTMIAYVGVRLA